MRPSVVRIARRSPCGSSSFGCFGGGGLRASCKEAFCTSSKTGTASLAGGPALRRVVSHLRRKTRSLSCVNDWIRNGLRHLGSGSIRAKAPRIARRTAGGSAGGGAPGGGGGGALPVLGASWGDDLYTSISTGAAALTGGMICPSALTA